MKKIIIIFMLFSVQNIFASTDSLVDKVRDNLMNAQKNSNNQPFISYVKSFEATHNVKCTLNAAEISVNIKSPDHTHGSYLDFSAELNCDEVKPIGRKISYVIRTTGDYYSDNSIIVKNIETYTPEADESYL